MGFIKPQKWKFRHRHTQGRCRSSTWRRRHVKTGRDQSGADARQGRGLPVVSEAAVALLIP